MADLSDFKKGQIVGARIVGVSVSKTVQMFGILRGTVFSLKKKKICLSKSQVGPKAEVVRERPSNFTSYC